MSSGHAQREEQRGALLAGFIVAHKSQILARWEASVRRLPSARKLPKPVLLDSVPQLLDAIARAISDGALTDSEIPEGVIEAHALQRLDTGFDLAQVVAEYGLLRDAILELRERDTVAVSEPGRGTTFFFTLPIAQQA